MKFYKLIAISKKEYDEDSGDKQADNKIYSQSCVFNNNKCYIYVDEKQQGDIEINIDELSDRLKTNRQYRNLEAWVIKRKDGLYLRFLIRGLTIDFKWVSDILDATKYDDKQTAIEEIQSWYALQDCKPVKVLIEETEE